MGFKPVLAFKPVVRGCKASRRVLSISPVRPRTAAAGRHGTHPGAEARHASPEDLFLSAALLDFCHYFGNIHSRRARICIF